MIPGLKEHGKSCLEAVLSFFYPEVCQYCADRVATARGGYICETCAQEAKFIEPPYCERCGLPFAGALTTVFECGNCRDAELHFSQARSAVSAEGMVLELIHRYKYQRALWLEPYLAGLLVQEAAPSIVRGDWDAIAPVPLHGLKRAERQFNQAERLCRHLARATGLPFAPKLLRRVTSTPTQTRLSRRARAANVRGAFELHPQAEIKDRRIVLVDDVFTTGATTSACARVLRRAGAADVCVWTLARGVLN